MSHSELHDALTDINGVGEARADEILDVLAEYNRGRDDAALREAQANLQKAADHHAEGAHEYAQKFVERARGAVEGNGAATGQE